MKKLFAGIFILTMIAVAGIISPASAADTIKDIQISSTHTAIDKNGNEYVRLIIQEPRELNGFKYNADVVVMAFGTAVARAKQLKAGDTIKAVLAENMYQGKKNYRVQQFLTQ